MAKQGTKKPTGRTVKNSHAKQLIVAAILAVIGITVYFVLQQYTYQAKLEQDLRNKETKIEQQLLDLQNKESVNAEKQKQIDDLNRQKQELEKKLQAKQTTKRVYAASYPIPEDAAKAYIYMKESGNNPGAINRSSGACGLGQALPCSKMGCSLSDYACQDAWFTQYMKNRYGTWNNAKAFWDSHKWW